MHSILMTTVLTLALPGASCEETTMKPNTQPNASIPSTSRDMLDYQFEIGRRHHRSGKNDTDGANATPQVEFRHLVALTIPITTTIRPFLERGGHSPEQVEAMHAAWVKSVLMQAILWSYPYVEDGGF